MKYAIFQAGGDNGAAMFNDYADTVISQSQAPDGGDYTSPQNSVEEEDPYISNLRAYDDEQQTLSHDDIINQKFADLEAKLDEKLQSLHQDIAYIDPFEDEEDHLDYINEKYNSANTSTPYAYSPEPRAQVPYAFPSSADSSITAGNSGKGSRNNYGNIRDTTTGKFKNFATPEEGKAALHRQLEIYKTGRSRTGVKSDSSLYQAMAVYAPASDRNNPKAYAEFIAKKLGISPDTPIKHVDTEQWAAAIAQMEGNKNIN